MQVSLSDSYTIIKVVLMKDAFKNRVLTKLGVNGGLIAIVLVANIFIGMDVSRRIASIQSDRREMAVRTQAAESLVVLKEESKKGELYTRILNGILPTNDELISFSRDLKAVAVKNSVDLGFKFSGGSDEAQGQLGHTNFKASATGKDFKNFLNFLRSMEAMPYFIDVSFISLNKSSSDFKSDIDGRVFSRP